MLNFEEAAATFHDYSAYEGEALHLLASIRWACWLMATAVAGGAAPFVILALLGFWSTGRTSCLAFFVLEASGKISRHKSTDVLAGYIGEAELFQQHASVGMY